MVVIEKKGRKHVELFCCDGMEVRDKGTGIGKGRKEYKFKIRERRRMYVFLDEIERKEE